MKSVFFVLSLVLASICTEESNEEIVYPIDQFFLNTEKYGETVDIFKVCDETIGCIETDSKWYHKKFRPINVRPLARHILKTDFLLIKKNQNNQDDLIYTSLTAKEYSIQDAGFKNDSELMILIHDFTANGYTGWIKHLANTVFANLMDINIISVDWQRGAEPPYDQAIANARFVALETIMLIKELQEKLHYSLDNIHIVGHGVGAHLAGYIGITYNKIKKITGLDPSSLRFQGMPAYVKLNPTCAKYVEVIHTDHYQSSSQGIEETLGHSDFFVNAGHQQPGCPEYSTNYDILTLQRTSLKDGEILPGCSHKRAFKYFVEALVSKNCSFQGIKCGSLEDFNGGKCTSCNASDHDCRIFGLKTYSDGSVENKFFLNTDSKSPYCMLEYRITVHILDKKKYGSFSFILVDENANYVEASVSISDKETDRTFEKGSENNTFVYFANLPHLKNIIEIKIRWTEKEYFYCFLFCKLTVNVKMVEVTFLGTGNSDEGVIINFCPSADNVKIKSGSFVTLRRCTEKSEPFNAPLTSFNEVSTAITKTDRSKTNNKTKSIKATTSKMTSQAFRTSKNTVKHTTSLIKTTTLSTTASHKKV